MVYIRGMFTVKQLSKLAGVTPRTLHHYDAIGLLKPSRIGDNGYRYYEEQALLRLQQILFYRELDLPLDDIKSIMAESNFDVLGALQSHKDALNKQVVRLNRLLATVDNTIQYLKGETKMSEKGLFEGFTEEEEKKYALEAEQMYDPETVRASSKKWKVYSDADKKRILAEGKTIYTDLAAVMPKGADSKQAQAIVARWHQHMQNFWSPNDEQLLGLADLYNADPRFRANYEQVAPGLAEFMREAVKVYVGLRKK
jgi:DNA-binding transcriptional MerR regulator